MQLENPIKIKSSTVLLFDMDGTLIDTDFANFLSYKKAIQSVVKADKEILYNKNKRFNRTLLKGLFPNLTEREFVKIVEQKEKNYKEYLPQTKVNKSVEGFLMRYSKTNRTVLVTNCRKDRALLTLNYYNLAEEFTNLFFRQVSVEGRRINKYKNAISSLGLSASLVVAFENEEEEIADAILAGIPVDNIISI